ncbi:helix-turn-helix transcriptional regulator [Robbsia andropogonis]|nr:AlpA family phage regulatory protein [Robbsia andropogonis]
MRDLPDRVGIGRSTIFGLIKEGSFPRAFSIGHSRAKGWHEHEVEAWIARHRALEVAITNTWGKVGQEVGQR